MRRQLLRDNLLLLERAEALLRDLPQDLYRSRRPELGLASIGEHFRHCLDLYRLFLDGISVGAVDYDQRAREVRIECDPEAARERLHACRAALRALDPRDSWPPLRIQADCREENGGSPAPWCPTSTDRELLYLMQHAIHHFALIAVLLRAHGRIPPSGFGYAPSTLRHLAARGSCAP